APPSLDYVPRHEHPPLPDYVPRPEHPPSPDYVPSTEYLEYLAPPSLDYVPRHEHPPSPDYVPRPEHPPSPDYVPSTKYLEYLVPADDEAPIEDQPLPADASPTTLSPGYIADSDPSEEDREEDPAEYPADGGDDDDDDDDDDDEEEAFEEEEHLAPANFTTLPVTRVPFSQTRLRRARKSVRLPLPMAASTEALIADMLLHLLHHYHHHLYYHLGYLHSHRLPHHHYLYHPPTYTSPTYAEALLGYRAARIQDDLLEADMPLRKRARFTALTGRFEVGDSLSAAAARQTRHTLAHRVDYGFINTIDASIHASESRAMTAVEEVNERVTDLAITQRQETHELQRERRYFHLMASSYEREAADARWAWAHSESRSHAMEAQIRALQRDVDVLKRQRIRDEDRLTSHIQHEHDMFRELVRTAEAGP
ncbi:hypothetical protein Tco_1324890, partial [Tanacetum coccineum]